MGRAVTAKNPFLLWNSNWNANNRLIRDHRHNFLAHSLFSRANGTNSYNRIGREKNQVRRLDHADLSLFYNWNYKLGTEVNGDGYEEWLLVVRVLTKMIVCLVGSKIISKPPECTELLFRLKYTLESFIIFLSWKSATLGLFIYTLCKGNWFANAINSEKKLGSCAFSKFILGLYFPCFFFVSVHNILALK